MVHSFAPVLAGMKGGDAGPDYRIELAEEIVHMAFSKGGSESPKSGTRAYNKGEAFGEKLVHDFANDVDGLVLEGSLAPGFDATLRFHFRSDPASPFVHVLTAHPDRVAAPSSAFWHLPVDPSMAFFAEGADAVDLEGVRASLFGALEDALKSETCDNAIAYLDQRVRALFLTGGPFVVGFGNDMPGAETALASFRHLTKATDATRFRTRQALSTWVLLEVDEPLSKWVEPLRELALMDKKFATCKPPPPDLDGVPGKAGGKSTEHSVQDVVAVPPSVHLPKGTLHITSLATPTKDAPKDAPPMHMTHLFVVPDGEHTWFAIGDNEATVVSRVKAALEGAPASGKLGARAGLDSLHAPAAGAGFLTMQGVVMLGVKGVTDDDLRGADSKITMLQGLPLKGAVPFPITWRTPPREIALRVLVPPVLIPELLRLAK